MRVTRFGATLALVLGVVGVSMAAEKAAAPSAPAPALDEVALLQVEGTVTISPEGRVEHYTLGTPVPGALADNVDRAVRQWVFHPVLENGTPRQARSRMRIALAARKDGDGFAVRVDNVSFPAPESLVTRNGIAAKKLTPPRYPALLQRAGVSGKTLLQIRIGADGRVAEVASVQSMLFDVRGSERNLRKAIKMLEDNAIGAVRTWTFEVPPALANAPAGDMTVSVPIEYRLGETAPTPGQWQWVVRLPYRQAPWLPVPKDAARIGVADVADGEIAGGEAALRLVNDVNGQALGEMKG